jgi:hypothetical protein
MRTPFKAFPNDNAPKLSFRVALLAGQGYEPEVELAVS